MTATPALQQRRRASRRGPRRWLWLSFGWLSLGLAALGVVLPLLPTTPLVILAAACFARSSPRLRRWLVKHPQLGPAIRAWEKSGAIPRRAKHLGYFAMLVALGISVALGVPLWALAVQVACMAGAALYVATRPDAAPNAITIDTDARAPTR